MSDQERTDINKQCRYWTWTLNNWTPEEQKELVWQAEHQEKDITYICFEEEVGENGTPHLQGYIEFSKRKRGLWIKNNVNGMTRAHLACTKGSAEENIVYCSKDDNGTFYEFGTAVNQGKKGGRSDLAAACELLKVSGIKRLAQEHPTTFVKYAKGFQELNRIYDRPEESRPDLKVTLIRGPTGTGKTRHVHDTFPPEDLWVWGGDRWFDGYHGQEVALFDDYNGEIPMTNFLKILDIYALQVPVKGGFVWFKPKLIYITSNVTPEEWYPKSNNPHIEALKRRIVHTIIKE